MIVQSRQVDLLNVLEIHQQQLVTHSCPAILQISPLAYTTAGKPQETALSHLTGIVAIVEDSLPIVGHWASDIIRHSVVPS